MKDVFSARQVTKPSLPTAITLTAATADADASIALHQAPHHIARAAINDQFSKADLVLDLRNQPGVEGSLIIARTGKRAAYCDMLHGHLDHHKQNPRFDTELGGWSTQNNVSGALLSQNSNEGIRTRGSRRGLMDSTACTVNKKSSWGTSTESAHVVEYHLDCSSNDHDTMNTRWENSGSGARVMSRAGGVGNIINHGYGSHSIESSDHKIKAAVK